MIRKMLLSFIFFSLFLMSACTDSSEKANEFIQAWENTNYSQHVSTITPKGYGFFSSPLEDARKQQYTEFLHTVTFTPQKHLSVTQENLTLTLEVSTDDHFLSELIMRFYSDGTASLFDNEKDKYYYFSFQSDSWEQIIEDGYTYYQEKLSETKKGD